jgi:hypothetical protein
VKLTMGICIGMKQKNSGAFSSAEGSGLTRWRRESTRDALKGLALNEYAREHHA